jgi:hypothetical protein
MTLVGQLDIGAAELGAIDPGPRRNSTAWPEQETSRFSRHMKRRIESVYHLAETDNLASILEHGLMSTKRSLDLMRIAESERGEFLFLRRHRPENVRLSEGVVIRDQRPMPPAALTPALDDDLVPSDVAKRPLGESGPEVRYTKLVAGSGFEPLTSRL